MRTAMNRLRVWPKAKDVVLGGKRDRLVLCRHHPDQLRRPASRPGALQADNLEHTLMWSVFRTLELLPPAFWLRRLQARLQGAQTLEAAPHIVHVELWRALPLPPAQRDAQGRHAARPRLASLPGGRRRGARGWRAIRRNRRRSRLAAANGRARTLRARGRAKRCRKAACSRSGGTGR